MNKGLEALYRIANANNHFKYDTLELMDKDFQIVKQELQRLESIDNIKPSEALKCLEEMARYRIEYSEYSMPIKDISEYKKIKQALLKAQEQEKVIEIIKVKWVNIAVLIHSKTIEEYNNNAHTPYNLTQEEFDLLKRCFNE